MSAMGSKTLPSSPHLDVAATRLESFSSKLLLILAMAVPVVVNAVVFALQVVGWSDTGGIRELVFSYQALISPVVQLLASSLQFCQIYALFTAFEFLLRSKITQGSTTLGQLRFRVAIISRKLDRSLPRRKILVLIPIILLALTPAPLWAASLSPQLSTTLDRSVNLTIPTLGNDGFLDIFHSDYAQKAEVFASPLGTFSPYMARHFLSDILLIASRSTNSSQMTKRFDNTQNLYVDRSYGVGGAVGLTDSHLSQMSQHGKEFLQGYSYPEAGFNTVVDCTYIPASPWGLSLVLSGSGGVPSIFDAHYTGTDDPGHYATWGFSQSTVVAWSSVSLGTPGPSGDYTLQRLGSNKPVGQIYVTAGSDYSYLNNISCSVNFEPKWFKVSLNKTEGVINVTNESDFYGELDPDWNLRNLVMEQLYLVSQSTHTLYFSAIGDAFMENMKSSAASRGNDESSNLTAVAESFTFVLDSILLSITSAQTQGPIFYENSTMSHDVPVERTLASVRIGSWGFVVALSVLNLASLFGLLFLAVRTSFWAGLPKFNILDIGSDIFASVVKEESVDFSGSWNGDRGDRRIERIGISVRWESIRQNVDSWRLVLGVGDGLSGKVEVPTEEAGLVDSET